MFVVFSILAVIIGGAAIFFRTMEQTVLDAYRVWGTADMLVDYMETNDGQWPSNWEDVREFMAEHGSQYKAISSFEELRLHMEIDFSFDPASLDTSLEFDELKPRLRAIWLRNGKTTAYQGCRPNEIIFEYLKNRAQANPLSINQTEANKSLNPSGYISGD